MGKAVKSIFGGSKPKAPPPPPPPPTEVSAAPGLKAAADEQRMRAGAAGRASTMLTGGEGVKDDVETAKKKLLGA
jgi:hypothetical protein